jgi:valyl-tRNA synthetase
LLRLLHPLIPFVTEVLWTTLTGRESIVVASWPVAEPSRADAGAEAHIARVQTVVSEVRRFRADQGLKPSARIPARLTGLTDGVAEVRWLLRLDEPGGAFQPTASVAVPGGVLVELDLSGTVDVAVERARYAKDLAAAVLERDKTAAKLANPTFAEKAPEHVVAKTRDRLAAAEVDIARIEAALAALPAA